MNNYFYTFSILMYKYHTLFLSKKHPVLRFWRYKVQKYRFKNKLNWKIIDSNGNVIKIIYVKL